MNPIIKVDNLTHKYGDRIALDWLSFRVEKGQICSLLGPNGAGKTTILNILNTLLKIQEGEASIAGLDLKTDIQQVRKIIGIVFQDECLDTYLTAEETLEFQGRIYGMPKEERASRIDELLKLFDLDERRSELIKSLSGGMKRRLEIARGLLTKPQVLFLDEPTVGLDPQMRMKVWGYIEKVRSEGITVLLTTHYMDEADSLSDFIYIMDYGRVVASGTSEALKNALGQGIVHADSDDNPRLEAFIGKTRGVRGVSRSPKGLSVTLSEEGSTFIPRLMESTRGEAFKIRSISLQKPSLDDVFLTHTGRELREESPAKEGA
jgi:ABC-2 type transport system ATP-binding protein